MASEGSSQKAEVVLDPPLSATDNPEGHPADAVVQIAKPALLKQRAMCPEALLSCFGPQCYGLNFEPFTRSSYGSSQKSGALPYRPQRIGLLFL